MISVAVQLHQSFIHIFSLFPYNCIAVKSLQHCKSKYCTRKGQNNIHFISQYIIRTIPTLATAVWLQRLFSDNSDTADAMFFLVQMSCISHLNYNELETAQCVSTNKSKWNTWASGETNFKQSLSGKKSRCILKWFCNASNDQETNLFAMLQHITGKTHHIVD